MLINVGEHVRAGPAFAPAQMHTFVAPAEIPFEFKEHAGMEGSRWISFKKEKDAAGTRVLTPK